MNFASLHRCRSQRLRRRALLPTTPGVANRRPFGVTIAARILLSPYRTVVGVHLNGRCAGHHPGVAHVIIRSSVDRTHRLRKFR